MDMHEFQAKTILRHYGLPIPPWKVASTLQEVEQAISEMSLTQAVLKIQVHAGGRGKAGGVKFAKNREEILSVAKQLIGMKMVNNQTGLKELLRKKY